MLTHRVILKTVIFVSAIQFGCSIRGAEAGYLPNLNNYNPLKDEGYVPKTDNWLHFSEDKDLSASVADFISESGECVRVVTFTGQRGAMEDIKVSCNSPDPFVGLVQSYDKLWFFGTAFVKRLGKKTYSSTKFKNRFIVLKGNEDLKICKKTWWVIDELCIVGCPMKAIGKSPHTVKLNEDEDCSEVIHRHSLLPMIIYSPNGAVGNLQPTNEWTTFNAWEAVGASIREYKSGPECVQLLVLYSYGRPLTSMKVACGQLRGVSMTDKTFYYGRTVMLKVHDDPNTFTVFYHPRNGRQTDTSQNAAYISGTLPTVCIKKKFRLVKDNERYIKKKISTIVEYEIRPDCAELVEGKVQGSTVDATVVDYLLNTLYKDQSNVGVDLKGYKMTKKFDDFNLVTDLGAIIMFFEKSESEQRKVVLVVARGVILTGVMVPMDKKLDGVDSDSLVIRGDELIYNRDIMLKKESETFIVLASNPGNKCTKTTYSLKSSGGKNVKEDKSKQSVDTGDTDCKELLEGTRLMNPEAKTYNTATTLPQNINI